MLKYALALTLAASLPTFLEAGNIDVVTVGAFAGQAPFIFPGCGQIVTGSSSESTSFSCTWDDPVFGPESFFGHASGQTGIGPYGVGVQMAAGASDAAHK